MGSEGRSSAQLNQALPALDEQIMTSSDSQMNVLNKTDKPQICSRSAVDASKDLQKLMLRMKGEVITEDGTGVKYDELKNNKLFAQFKEQAAQLDSVDLSKLAEDEKSAFFINIYNALTIHGLAECETLPNSVLNVQLFWKVTAYSIGGLVFSLDDIEHGILRANRPHPASKTPPFDAKDPRIQFVVLKRDPRIHFALVCGAKSCPAIQVYTAANLDRALDAATRSFCSQEVKVYEMAKEIRLSRIFQWYKVDFGANDVEAIKWTLPFLSEEKAKAAGNVLHQLEELGMVDITYSEYDWSLNSDSTPKISPRDISNMELIPDPPSPTLKEADVKL